jgi:NitT/TauT family transport system ATP-binding protein
MVRFSEITKSFQAHGQVVHALGPVSLDVIRGEFLAIVGPSGCGKSTLLNLTAGLAFPTSGEVSFDGKSLSAVNTRVGYLTQKDTLLPWRTAAANVAIGLEIQGVPSHERSKLVHDQLARVGLADFARHFPAQLSGGMRRRLALARMMVRTPDTLLMDEPFAALDTQLRMDMHEQLLRIWEEERKTVIFVTHDLQEALTLADRVVVMSQRPGRVRMIEPVPLGRPRDVHTIQMDSAFSDMYRDLWSRLREAPSMDAR